MRPLRTGVARAAPYQRRRRRHLRRRSWPALTSAPALPAGRHEPSRRCAPRCGSWKPCHCIVTRLRVAAMTAISPDAQWVTPVPVWVVGGTYQRRNTPRQPRSVSSPAARGTPPLLLEDDGQFRLSTAPPGYGRRWLRAKGAGARGSLQLSRVHGHPAHRDPAPPLR